MAKDLMSEERWFTGTFRWLRVRMGGLRLVTRRLSRSTRTGPSSRIGGEEALPVAPIDLSAGCSHVVCRLMAHHVYDWLSKAHSPESWRRPLLRAWRQTTALIDLRAWGGYPGWLAAVKKETGGNMGREVRKARRLGYVTRLIVPGALEGSIAEIRRSKTVRAYGPMSEVGSRTAARDAHDGASRMPPRPDRETHWELGWGVFRQEEGRDVLRAYAITVRIGNLLLFMKFMGHGAVLRDGVTKLLMVDIMDWVYSGADGLTDGVEFIWYAPFESAAPGLVEWMKDFTFRAHLLQVAAPPPLDELPPGFSGRRYLALNPDVAAAGFEARTHWLLFGAKEGRRYR